MRMIGILFFLLFPAILPAQTLTMGDYLSSLQLSRINHSDTLLPLYPFESGLGLLWDFSGVSDSIDTIPGWQIVAPPYPLADSFPTANLCYRESTRTEENYIYYRVDGNDLWQLGAWRSTDGQVSVSDPGFLLRFPIEEGSGWDFTCTTSVMSYPMIYNNHYSVLGTGKVVTPDREYAVIATISRWDAVWYFPGDRLYFNGQTATAYDMYLGQVALWDSTEYHNPSFSQLTLSESWTEFIDTGVRDNLESRPPTCRIFPCPTRDWIGIDGLTGPAIMEILSLDGSILQETPISPAVPFLQLSLPPGVYPVRFRCDEGIMSSKIIIAP